MGVLCPCVYVCVAGCGEVLGVCELALPLLLRCETTMRALQCSLGPPTRVVCCTRVARAFGAGSVLTGS